MTYTNWKDLGVPFENFTEELTYEWMRNRFSREECKEWLDIGIKVEDANFAKWLRDIKKLNTDWILNNSNERNLRKKYEEFLKEVSDGSKLSIETIEKIKNLPPYYKYNLLGGRKKNLAPEQQLLVNESISTLKLRDRYKLYGLCQGCSQPNIGENWCKTCNAKYFQTQFKSWTSVNSEIDKFIQESQLQASSYSKVLWWMPYEKFTDIEYLAEGGFSKVYKATYKGKYELRVVLKVLKDSQNITDDFLREINYNKLIDSSNSRKFSYIVRCYGISQDPETNNYIMVMDYIKGNNMREFLQNNHEKLDFWDKSHMLLSIVERLYSIHKKGLIHCDLHPGNILSCDYVECIITDLGLSKPAGEKYSKGKVYGVLPYVAPEVLRGQSYTQASDIYSLGVIVYEILSGKPPYYKYVHDEFLAVKICEGLRPNIDEITAPQLLKDLIGRCWNADPSLRPKISEIIEISFGWVAEVRVFNKKKDTGFYSQFKEIEKRSYFWKSFEYLFYFVRHEILDFCWITSNSSSLKSNPHAIYASHLLSYKNLPEPINSQKTNEIFYKISEELESLRITDTVKFNKELKRRIQEEKTEQETQNQIEISPKRNN